MSRVFWTDDEQTRVLTEVARNMTTGAFGRGEFMPLLRNAQRVLPEERRRNLDNSLGSYGPLLREQAIELRRKQAAEPAEKPATPAPEAQTRVDPLAIMFQVVTEGLVEKITKAVRAEIRSALASQNAGRPPEPPVAEFNQSMPYVAEPKPRAPRITVIGSPPDQRRWLEQQYSRDDCRFTFLDTDKVLNSRDFGSPDLVVGMLKSMGHKHSDAVKRAGLPHKFVYGGTTKLKQVLDDYLLTLDARV